MDILRTKNKLGCKFLIQNANSDDKGHTALIVISWLLFFYSNKSFGQREYRFYDPEFTYEYCLHQSIYKDILPEQLNPTSYYAFFSPQLSHVQKTTVEQTICNKYAEVLNKSVYNYNQDGFLINVSILQADSSKLKCGIAYDQNHEAILKLCTAGNDNIRSEMFFYNDHLIQRRVINSEKKTDTCVFRYNGEKRLIEASQADNKVQIDYEILPVENLFTLIPKSIDLKSVRIRDNFTLLKIRSSFYMGRKYLLIGPQTILGVTWDSNNSSRYDFKLYLFNDNGKLDHIYFYSNSLSLEASDSAHESLTADRKGKNWKIKQYFYGKSFRASIHKTKNSVTANFIGNTTIYNLN